MNAEMDRDGVLLLQCLAEYGDPRLGNPDEDPKKGHYPLRGYAIEEKTSIKLSRLRDAAKLLEKYGFAHVRQAVSGDFAIELTSLGRYQNRLLMTTADGPGDSQPPVRGRLAILRCLMPAGSPYGFTDQDWEYIYTRRQEQDCLRVVFGYQFRSQNYDSARLVRNLEQEFSGAVEQYNSMPGNDRIFLDFKELRAGYGEHVFNQIARDIISSDIAVFETSDLNPNVMIEMGVALTWGVRVLPIRAEGTPQPPSDISGQTWAIYQDSGQNFHAPDFRSALAAMIARAMLKGWAG